MPESRPKLHSSTSSSPDRPSPASPKAARTRRSERRLARTGRLRHQQHRTGPPLSGRTGDPNSLRPQSNATPPLTVRTKGLGQQVSRRGLRSGRRHKASTLRPAPLLQRQSRFNLAPLPAHQPIPTPSRGFAHLCAALRGPPPPHFRRSKLGYKLSLSGAFQHDSSFLLPHLIFFFLKCGRCDILKNTNCR